MRVVTASCALAIASSAITAQTIQPPFDTMYTLVDLGTAPGVPASYGGVAFNNPLTTVVHGLSGPAGAGSFKLTMTIPNDTNLLNTDSYFQSVYVDAGAPQSVSASGGVKLRVR